MSGTILRRLSSLAIAALAAVTLSSCGSKKPTLYIYNWCDYLNPEVKEAFEKEYNCRIVEDIFDSNEMLEAKLRAGASDYDIVVPSNYAASRMYRQGMLRPLDPARLASVTNNLDPAVLAKLPANALEYGVPYMVSFTGIGYLKSKIKDFEPSWGMFDRADHKGRIAALSDNREVIGAALKFLGYSANSTNPEEIKAAVRKVFEWKRNIAQFDNEKYKQGIGTAEFHLVQGYVGDMLQIRDGDEDRGIKGNDDIEIVIPREGTQISVDMLSIPANARNADLAYKFIEFVHRPENAAKNTEFICYQCPNTASYPLLPEEVRNDPLIFVDEELFEKSDVLTDLGDAQALYQKYWEEITGKDKFEE